MIIKLEALIKGTRHEQRLQFAKVSFLSGVCSETEYRKERIAIAEEVKKDIEQKFAYYENLRKGETV